MIYIDDNSQRVVRAKHSGDIVYDVNMPLLGSALATEDLQLLGNWQDYTGSGQVPSMQQQMWGGKANQLQGTDGGLQDPTAHIGNINVHGNDSQTWRTRYKRIYKDFK